MKKTNLTLTDIMQIDLNKESIAIDDNHNLKVEIPYDMFLTLIQYFYNGGGEDDDLNHRLHQIINLSVLH